MPRIVYLPLVVLCTLPIVLAPKPIPALTISLGEPHRGNLISGVTFPSQLPGYNVRDEERSYTTPEVIGALLDAFETFGEQYPSSCELFMGDFSRDGGGWLRHHKSHQNGRDVDMGMYARGNVSLDRFIPMNSENLDIPKTWTLVQSLLATQRVERIFVDTSIQRLLYDYALSTGVDSGYLDRLFLNAGAKVPQAIIQHEPGHRDHLHVRFFAPWSTLAGQVKKLDAQKQMMIEVAQQSYLPKKVNYYVKGNEPSLNALARSFGVRTRDLCKWNGIYGNEVLKPGSCLVFYKRGFEVEPVHLARSLQPHHIAEANPILLASVPAGSVADIREPLQRVISPRARKSSLSIASKPSSHTVRRGDTLAKIAKQNGMTVAELLKLNGMKKVSALKAGQSIKVAAVDSDDALKSTSVLKKMAAIENAPKSVKGKPVSVRVIDSREARVSIPDKSTKSVKEVQTSNSKPEKNAKAQAEKNLKSHMIRSGDTLWDVAKKYQVSTEDICRLNSISTKSGLRPGTTLKLPKR
jgi:LysM repeat protein/murein endopeptidase